MLYGTIAEFCNKETVSAKARLKAPAVFADPTVRPFSAQSCRPGLGASASCLSSPVDAKRGAQQQRLTYYAPSSLVSFEFLFEDGTTYKKPTALPACEYVDALMNWVQSLLDDEEIFPSRIGASPPRARTSCLTGCFLDNSPLCVQVCRFRSRSDRPARRSFAGSSGSMATSTHRILTRFARLASRVRSYLGQGHPLLLADGSLHSAAHLNTNYRHFLLFVTEFSLVDKKELMPLADFNDAILNEEKK